VLLLLLLLVRNETFVIMTHMCLVSQRVRFRCQSTGAVFVLLIFCIVLHLGIVDHLHYLLILPLRLLIVDIILKCNLGSILRLLIAMAAAVD